jgi:hypothetical protein
MMSTNHSERLKSLSPEKRVLLLKALGKEAVQAEQSKRIPRRSQQNSAPLSFAQQRLWFLDRLSPENPAYNLPAAVRLQGQLNLSVVQQTLNEIVRRHEVLRTAFAEVDGQPVQVISPSLNFALSVVNLRHLPETEQQAEIEQRTLEEAQRPFDLTRSPLLLGTLLQVSPAEYVLLLTIHHIIAVHKFTIPKAIAEEMTLLSQREKATLFMTLLAAFKTLLYRYTGQEYILVGSPIANRNRREIEEV